jgi:hypothetical protein
MESSLLRCGKESAVRCLRDYIRSHFVLVLVDRTKNACMKEARDESVPSFLGPCGLANQEPGHPHNHARGGPDSFARKERPSEPLLTVFPVIKIRRDSECHPARDKTGDETLEMKGDVVPMEFRSPFYSRVPQPAGANHDAAVYPRNIEWPAKSQKPFEVGLSRTLKVDPTEVVIRFAEYCLASDYHVGCRLSGQRVQPVLEARRRKQIIRIQENDCVGPG